MADERFLTEALELRRREEALRSLRYESGLVDLCSNDYLGMARDAAFRQHLQQALLDLDLPLGSTGSRLLSGAHPELDRLEAQLAEWYAAEAALVYNSGYDANLGLFSCIAQRGDTLLYDRLIHASIRDAVWLSHAAAHSFHHNDLQDLENRIRRSKGRVFVSVESVYSMDGDLAPLAELSDLCQHYGAHLIVDEAHGFGVFGPQGSGRVQELGLEQQVLARLHTFGKALGLQGAVLLGSSRLRDYLINFSRPLIYTTAMAPSHAFALREAHQHLRNQDERRKRLMHLVAYYRNKTVALERLDSPSPIQPVLVPGNRRVRQMADRLRQSGLDVRAILHPTVEQGAERLRVVLHSFNTEAELDSLVDLLDK